MVSNIFYFHPAIWGRFPSWRAYFSDGLVQPPTSNDKLPTLVTPIPTLDFFHMFSCGILVDTRGDDPSASHIMPPHRFIMATCFYVFFPESIFAGQISSRLHRGHKGPPSFVSFWKMVGKPLGWGPLSLSTPYTPYIVGIYWDLLVLQGNLGWWNITIWPDFLCVLRLMPGKPVSVEIHKFKHDSGDHRNFF